VEKINSYNTPTSWLSIPMPDLIFMYKLLPVWQYLYDQKP